MAFRGRLRDGPAQEPIDLSDDEAVAQAPVPKRLRLRDVLEVYWMRLGMRIEKILGRLVPDPGAILNRLGEILAIIGKSS